jgi:hypothetical protein
MRALWILAWGRRLVALRLLPPERRQGALRATRGREWLTRDYQDWESHYTYRKLFHGVTPKIGSAVPDFVAPQ